MGTVAATTKNKIKADTYWTRIDNDTKNGLALAKFIRVKTIGDKKYMIDMFTLAYLKNKGVDTSDIKKDYTLQYVRVACNIIVDDSFFELSKESDRKAYYQTAVLVRHTVDSMLTSKAEGVN